MNIMHLSAFHLKSMALSVYRSFFSVPHFSDYDKYCKKYRNLESSDTRTLDLGCGKTPKNPFSATVLFGVDVDYGIDQNVNILPCDLGVETLPFPDSYFDYVSAFDLLEHIPRLIYKKDQRHYPFIFLMSEIYRVLKKDGVFFSDTPAYPRFSAFADPTHVNVITTETFKLYFCEPFNWATRYGFDGKFKLCTQGWHKENLISIMTKSQKD